MDYRPIARNVSETTTSMKKFVIIGILGKRRTVSYRWVVGTGCCVLFFRSSLVRTEGFVRLCCLRVAAGFGVLVRLNFDVVFALSVFASQGDTRVREETDRGW